jgi:hypothetical protein
MRKTRTQSKVLPLIPAPPPLFDMNSRRIAQSIEMPVMDPLDLTKETGWFVRVRAPQSEFMREAAKAWYAEHVPDGKLGAGQWIEFSHAMARAAVESWRGLGNGADEVLSTPENIAAMCTNPEYIWFVEQVSALFGEKSRFFGQTRSD